MNSKYLLKASVADIPFCVNTDNSRLLSYAKATLKNFLGFAARPYFSITLNSLPEKKSPQEQPDIRIARRNSCFIILADDPKMPNQEIGLIDKRHKTCRLNISSLKGRGLFHPFLATACALFLSQLDGFIIHAAGIIYKDSAYIFIGPSGSGKSTFVSILSKKGVGIISEEKVIIRQRNNCFMAYALPWSRDKNQRAPVKALFFLKKADEVCFKQLSSPSAVSALLSNITLNIPDREVAKIILESLSKLCKQIPCYEMRFAKNSLFWEPLKNLN